MIVTIIKPVPGRKWTIGQTPDLSQSYARQLIADGYASDGSHLLPETTPEKPKEEQIVHVIHHNAEDLDKETAAQADNEDFV